MDEEFSPSPVVEAVADASVQPKPLEYEETPLIESIIEPVLPHQTPLLSQKHSSLGEFLRNLLLFIVLFVVGVGLSVFLRHYMSTNLPTQHTTNSTSIDQLKASVSTPTPSLYNTVPPVPTDPYALWNPYQVISGTSKQAIAGITFKLPQDILSPICDGASCASQGTYLPGGSRFTVAPRGTGQLLSDFRGKVVSDLAGRSFQVKTTTVAGKNAVEFWGLFTGTTVGGYSFSQMRGVMIEVSDTLSVEFNHFTPTGVNADFATDDALLDTILKTVVFTGYSSAQKGAVFPLPTASQSASPSSY